MLHNELSAHQHDHAEQGRAQHQLGVPEGLEQLTGQVGNDEPQKGDGPHHGGGHGDVEGHAQQQAPDAFVIVHAQVDGLIFAQGEHVQQPKLPPQGEGHNPQHGQGEENEFGVNVVKASHQGRQQRVVLVGVHHTGQGRLDAGKERGQHRADEQHIQHIVLGLFK